MSSPVVRFRASPRGLLAQLHRRGRAPGIVAQRDLRRYYAALEAEATTIGLSDAERAVVSEALRGGEDPGLLWAAVEAACRRRRLHDRHGVDLDALIARLRGLTYTQALALIDAADTRRYAESG